LRACRAIVFKSNLQSKLTVATMFLVWLVIYWAPMQVQQFQAVTHCKVGVKPLPV
jgi:hypothetical protein